MGISLDRESHPDLPCLLLRENLRRQIRQMKHHGIRFVEALGIGQHLAPISEQGGVETLGLGQRQAKEIGVIENFHASEEAERVRPRSIRNFCSSWIRWSTA